MRSSLLVTLGMVTLVWAGAAMPPALLAAADEGKEEEEKPPLLYYQVPKQVLVSFPKGRSIGFLRIQLEIASRGQENIDLIEKHLPLLQNAMVMQMSDWTYEEINNRDERNWLIAETEARLSEVIEQETGEDIIEQVLFTSYIHQ